MQVVKEGCKSNKVGFLRDGLPIGWTTGNMKFQRVGLPIGWITEHMAFQRVGLPIGWITEYMAFQRVGVGEMEKESKGWNMMVTSNNALI